MSSGTVRNHLVACTQRGCLHSRDTCMVNSLAAFPLALSVVVEVTLGVGLLTAFGAVKVKLRGVQDNFVTEIAMPHIYVMSLRSRRAFTRSTPRVPPGSIQLPVLSTANQLFTSISSIIQQCRATSVVDL